MKFLAILPCVALAVAQGQNPAGVGFAFGQAGIEQSDTSDGDFDSLSQGSSRGGAAQCKSGEISVTAGTSKNLNITNFELPKNQSQVTETFLQYITSGGPFQQSIMGGTQNISGTFKIGATLCKPKNGTTPKGVQLLTHGVGFDRYYWDFAPGYSYVDVAAKNGYATFFYDRLSIGSSQIADPLQEVQAPLEVEIARSIAASLRNGTYGPSFSTVVGVGHSYGSVITEAITSLYPQVLDAAILTGFSVNATGLPLFLLGNDFQLANHNLPYRYGALNNGFLVANTITNNEIAFFRAPNFDPAVLALANANKGSVTFGELFTTTAPIGPATQFDGPVAVVNGDADLPFCSGNCSYPHNLANDVKSALYADLSADKFDSYLAPHTGHGLNLHYTALDAFAWIHEFLDARGLGQA